MTLLIFLVMLVVLVMVHELGHFLMAKRAGVLVEEFGFGLPPRLWGKKRGETVYSVNWLPIGGFVKLFGEDSEESVNLKTQSEKLPRAFFSQKKGVRLVILMAGVVMNFVLGVVVFSVIYSIVGIPTQTETVRVMEVLAESPAGQAGIKPNEVVMALGREPIKSTERFIELIEQSSGNKLQLTLGDGQEGKYGRLVEVTPRAAQPQTRRKWEVGIVISAVEMKYFPWWQMPVRGAWVGFKEAIAWGMTIGRGLGELVARLVVAGEVPKDVIGPVGIFQLTGDVKRAGILPLLQFMGVLSVNLAVLNLLPLPALDGGRLAFLFVEAVTRKKLKPGVEKVVHAAGLAVLLALMVWVTVNDVVRISGAGSIWGLIQKLGVF